MSIGNNGNFQLAKECEWEQVGEGVERRIAGYNDDLMMVIVKFEGGAVGTPHTHPHSQSTYVVSGRFEFTIGGTTKVVEAGDTLFILADQLHGCVALESGELIDVFAPARQDFVG